MSLRSMSVCYRGHTDPESEFVSVLSDVSSSYNMHQYVKGFMVLGDGGDLGPAYRGGHGHGRGRSGLPDSFWYISQQKIKQGGISIAPTVTLTVSVVPDGILELDAITSGDTRLPSYIRNHSAQVGRRGGQRSSVAGHDALKYAWPNVSHTRTQGSALTKFRICSLSVRPRASDAESWN